MFVIIPDVLKDNPDIEQRVFGKNVEILVADKTHSNQISYEDWNRCDAVLAYDKLTFDEELLKKMGNCKVIVRVGVGYENIDCQIAKKLGIKGGKVNSIRNFCAFYKK